MNSSRFLAVLKSFCIILAFVLAVFVPASGNAQSQKKEPVIELSYNINYNFTQIPGKYCMYFASQINKATNGRVKVTTYPAGTISPPEAVYQTALTGIADMGQHTTTYTPGQFLALEATHVPYPFADGWVSSHVNTDFVNHFKPKSNSDTKFLFAAAPGPYVLQVFTKAGADITKVADMKGKKIRVTGAIGTSLVQAWGAVPVTITVNETYEAALKGLVDGTLLPIEAQKGWKLGEVSRSITLLPFGYCTSNVGVMNLKKWNSLPKDIQDIILKVAADMPDKAGKAWWYSDLEALDYCASKGVKVITPAGEDAKGWLEAVKPIVNDYIARANAAGLPAADYIKYIQDRGKYWTDNHTAKKDETLAWAQKELLPLQ